MNLKKIKYLSFLFIVIGYALVSCNKVDVNVGADSSLNDPNITYFDNYQVDIATYKSDSFLTSGHQVITLGYHNDPVFGYVTAGSYAALNLPANPFISDENNDQNSNQNLVFDSLELILKPSGQFYGDSTTSMKINVYQLSENIRNIQNGDNYYNTTTFKYMPNTIGEKTINLSEQTETGSTISIKLSPALGQDLLTKFQTQDINVSDTNYFANYFKGIFINTDSVITKSLAYFTASSDSALIRLNYHQIGLYPVPLHLDFNFSPNKQFNNISFRYTQPNFSAFIPNKEQLIDSKLSGNQAFMNSNLGADIKISFPSLLNLKELHPYIKIIRADLVVKPDITSYTYPYQLPKSVYLFATDTTNALTSPILDPSFVPQTGSLVTDDLYGENTYYSYDITSFINSKIAGGEFSTSALLLSTSLAHYDSGLQRLIINNQLNARSIQLKLYVLGL